MFVLTTGTPPMSSEAVCYSSCMVLCRAVSVGEEAGGREPMSGQSSCTLGWQPREDFRTISTWPWMGTWLCEATHPIQWRVDKGSPWYQGPQDYTILALKIQE